MNHTNRRSIFHQILIVNVVLSVLFICIFITNYLYASRKFKVEAEKYSEQIMDNITVNFQTETSRLTTFVKMCESDPSFVIAMSNKLPIQSFIQYGKLASEKLLIIQYSLPYAERVYAYVKNSGKFIMPKYVILDKEYFLNGFSNKEQVPDFSNSGNGFYSAGGKNYYVSNSYNYGTFIIELNTVKFCGLKEITSVVPDCEIIVLYENGRVFAASSGKAEEMIQDIDVKRATANYIGYSGEKFFLNKKSLPNGFQFILVEKASNIEKLQQQNNLIYIFAGIILLAGCILLVFLNTRIYLPLKEVTKKYASQYASHNEIDNINVMVNNIMNENKQMQNQILNSQRAGSHIELNYAIHSKQGISQQLADHLQNQYGQYRMMSIAIQNQTGGGEELFTNSDDYFMDTLGCKPIVINSFLHAYIISDEHDIDKIRISIDEYFCNIKPTTMVFIGLSDVSNDFIKLHQVYYQSYQRMLSNGIPLERKYAVNIQDQKVAQYCPATISFEIQNTIAKYSMSGTSKDLEETFERIFFSDNSIMLKDFISYYAQLAGLLLALANQANNVMEISEFKTTKTLTVYHPVYMYYILLDDYKRLNAGTSKEHTALRYEIVDYVNQHYTEALSLESISSYFGITPVYLSSWFKKNTGINLSIYINNKRMEEAKELILKHKHMKIADIARLVGISGASTFIRQFKNHTGCTPDQYRQLN